MISNSIGNKINLKDASHLGLRRECTRPFHIIIQSERNIQSSNSSVTSPPASSTTSTVSATEQGWTVTREHRFGEKFENIFRRLVG